MIRAAFKNLITNRALFTSRILQQYQQYSKLAQTVQQNCLDSEQRAVIAFHFMEQIAQLRQSTNSFQKENIANIIIQKAKVLKERKIIDEKWQNNLMKNIDIVWEGFNPRIGAKVNLQIYRQPNFIKVAKNGRIFFVPSFTTGQIIHKLINFYLRPQTKEDEIVQKKFIISGDQGTGMSFAYLIYDYLSEFILQYRMSSAFQLGSKSIFHFIPEKEFRYVKKILYVPLRQVKFMKQFAQHLSLYSSQQFLTKISKKTDSQRLFQILKQIRQVYRKKGIELLCIIDEINFYYSCFKQKKSIEKGLKSEINEKTLNDISFGLHYLSKNADSFVLNSSQPIEHRLISNWNYLSKLDQYFDIYEHQKSTMHDLHVGYSQYFAKKQGQLIIYEIFWQSLNYYLLTHRSEALINKLAHLRDIFEEAFGLPQSNAASNTPIPSQRQLLLWNNDIRHLRIRQTLEEEIELVQLISQLEQGDQSLSNKRESIKHQLINLKNIVQQSQYQKTKYNFQAYCKNGGQKSDTRFKIISWINKAVSNKIKAKLRPKLAQNQPQLQPLTIFNHQSINISSKSKEADEQIILNGDKIWWKRRQIIEIDFTQLVDNKRLSYTQKQQIQQQLNNLVETIGTGYTIWCKSNKVYYYMDLKVLWRMTLLKDQTKTSHSYKQVKATNLQS